MRREEPEQGRAVQLPERGFDHPFQDLTDHYTRYKGKEQPRTVSRAPLESLRVSSIAPPDHRTSDVCYLESHQRKTRLVGRGER